MDLLIKLSLSISIIGIFLLLVLSNILEPSLKQIKDITTNDINKKIKVHGSIINIKSYKETNFQIILIKDSTGKIDITTNKLFDLEYNQNIIVIGIVKEYKNNLQIQAEKIIINQE